ncbi:MAG: hypothetical protein KGY81_04790 [Phycisphaerae bacterium]|nr:hypothetical protein [Phycisphaerae bacterium]
MLHRQRAILILLTAALLLGCNGEISPGAPEPGDSPDDVPSMEDILGPTNVTVTPVPDPNAPPGPARTIYMVYLRLGTVEVPTGMASGSERLWSYLDEEPVAMYSTVLGLNGFRVGLGRPEAWDDLQRELKRMAGRQFKAQSLQLFSGRPGSAVLKAGQGVQTIFTYFNDQTLSGADYPPGDNLLTVGVTLERGRPDHVILTALPQIRSTRKRSVINVTYGVPTVRNQPVLFGFDPLTFQLAIPKDWFLVIGPGIRSRRPTSVAHHFLTFERKGMEYETLLILHPTIFPIEYQATPAR